MRVLGTILAGVLLVAIVGQCVFMGVAYLDRGVPVRIDLWLTAALSVFVLTVLCLMAFGNPPGKILSIAQAAFRESVRQPLFWALLVFFALLIFLSTLIPYFTMEPSEDLKLMMQLNLDAILLPTLILTVFTASISISEEIEQRTAMTLLSKPISRRHFLLGKYLGILLAASMMAGVLSFVMGAAVKYKIETEDLKADTNFGRPGDPEEVKDLENALGGYLPETIVASLRGLLLVFAEVQNIVPMIILIFSQVMILTAIAVALATRLPMVVNLTVCIVIHFVGRLTSILEAASTDTLVKFVAKIFATLLPGLNFYDMGPAIVSDKDVPIVEYVVPAVVHAGIYTTIALLFGLILFEDRDLA